MSIRLSSFRRVQLELYKKLFRLFQALTLQWVGVTTDSVSERKVFITFEIWIYFLQKHIDPLQEAFIYAPEPSEAHFIMDTNALFDMFWTVEQKHPTTLMIMLGRARTILYITQIGLV